MIPKILIYNNYPIFIIYCLFQQKKSNLFEYQHWQGTEKPEDVYFLNLVVNFIVD